MAVVRAKIYLACRRNQRPVVRYFQPCFDNCNDSVSCCSPIHFFFWNEKGLLNFVSVRIKLVHWINWHSTASKKNKLPFLLLKRLFEGHTKTVLKSISKFQLLFHSKNFEKYMIFYTLPWRRWNRTHKLWNTCVAPVTIAKLGKKCLEAAPTLKYEPLNSYITVLSVGITKIFQYYVSKHL